ncbi:hypothetical protein QVD17_04710 [Tagetes erecta]|uniref:EF-hand domain-containing protein n=1 Tax=Tagetes erecta TaxID=13708 RepID=A0AAD8LD69_TARER|nr:hypothetical protein QVD17_04710 [Tagetes erecta]
MTFMILEFIQYFFSQIMLYMIIYHKFMDHSKIHNAKQNPETNLSKRLLSFKERIMHQDEVQMVMENLGIFGNFKGESFPKGLNSEDLLNIFEEEEPRLDEVREAFEVFDENKDGFIDARELQRVLTALGLKDKAAINECKKMIKVFDDDNDGRINFHEFIKFMEGIFC